MHGTMVSPNYPEKYAKYVHKEYKIIAPGNSEIMLIFDDFDIPPSSNCSLANVTVIQFRYILKNWYDKL